MRVRGHQDHRPVGQGRLARVLPPVTVRVVEERECSRRPSANGAEQPPPRWRRPAPGPSRPRRTTRSSSPRASRRRRSCSATAARCRAGGPEPSTAGTTGRRRRPQPSVRLRVVVPPSGASSTTRPPTVGSPSSATPSPSVSSTGRTVNPGRRVTPSATSAPWRPRWRAPSGPVVVRQPDARRHRDRPGAGRAGRRRSAVPVGTGRSPGRRWRCR